MLGENIRNLRKENKISQEELAEKLGVSTDDILKSKTVIKNDNDTVNEAVIENIPQQKKSFKFNLTYLCILISLIVIALITFLICKGVSLKGMSSEEIYTLAMPTTVEIQAETDDGTKIGTGFFDDNEGTIITNYHVLKDAREGVAVLKNVGKFNIEKVVGYDENLDIAIIKIDYKNEKVLEKRTKQIEVGETVYALGSSEGLTNSFSSGIISSLDRTIDGNHYIQVTAPISHGNSGGPLIDKFGKVIGITSAGIEEGQNLNLVIPINAANLIERDEYWGGLSRLYNITRPNKKTFEQIKAEARVGKYDFYYKIDTGKYKGTVHYKDCYLLTDSMKVHKNAFPVADIAFKEGYNVCLECNCIE